MARAYLVCCKIILTDPVVNLMDKLDLSIFSPQLTYDLQKDKFYFPSAPVSTLNSPALKSDTWKRLVSKVKHFQSNHRRKSRLAMLNLKIVALTERRSHERIRKLWASKRRKTIWLNQMNCKSEIRMSISQAIRFKEKPPLLNSLLK